MGRLAVSGGIIVAGAALATLATLALGAALGWC